MFVGTDSKLRYFHLLSLKVTFNEKVKCKLFREGLSSTVLKHGFRETLSKRRVHARADSFLDVAHLSVVQWRADWGRVSIKRAILPLSKNKHGVGSFFKLSIYLVFLSLSRLSGLAASMLKCYNSFCTYQ